jgi:hypothetical protein
MMAHDVVAPEFEAMLRKDQSFLIALGVDGRRSNAELADDTGDQCFNGT